MLCMTHWSHCHWQPMKLDQTRRDVVPSLGPCDETGCGIAHSPEFRQQMVRDSVDQDISVVKSQSHIGVHHYLRRFQIMKMSDFANAMHMEIRHDTTHVLRCMWFCMVTGCRISSQSLKTMHCLVFFSTTTHSPKK